MLDKEGDDAAWWKVKEETVKNVRQENKINIETLSTVANGNTTR
jgi:hypothetical protein